MIHLADYIRRDNLIALDETSRENQVQRLFDLALEGAPRSARESVLADLQQHGLPAGLPLGRGFLLCHARSDNLDHIRMAIGWPPDAKQEPEARTLVAMLIPAHEARLYLSLLARLNRFLSDPAAAEALHEQRLEDMERRLERFDHPPVSQDA